MFVKTGGLTLGVRAYGQTGVLQGRLEFLV